jgi:CBS domain-containing protein
MPKVKDLMTTDVVTIRADQTLRQAIEKMTSGNFRRIPVVDGRPSWASSPTGTSGAH